MNSIKSISESDLEFIVVVAITTLAYSSYYFLAFSERAFSFFQRKLQFQNNLVNKFSYEKITGFICMGLVPFVIISFSLTGAPFYYGISGNFSHETIYYVLGASIIIIPLNILIAGKPENLKQYPQIKISNWSKSTVVVDCGGWIIYLLAYEFLFRGILFWGILPVLGLVSAITLSTAIYALVHIPKGVKETFGSIPVGIVVCLITFETGNIWASFFIHLVMALSNELVAFYRHPKMHYKKQPVKIKLK